MELREMRTAVPPADGRTATPIPLPNRMLPSTTLPMPDSDSPSVLSVKVLAPMKLRLPAFTWTPSE
jgi:hypothetical protein